MRVTIDDIIKLGTFGLGEWAKWRAARAAGAVTVTDAMSDADFDAKVAQATAAGDALSSGAAGSVEKAVSDKQAGGDGGA